ncbi:hypothetical protein ACOMHN_051273 [Nucella lapillus]
MGRAKFLHRMGGEKYKTIIQLVEGNFKTPVKKRTQIQLNAIGQFYRNKDAFYVKDKLLFYNGRQVVVTDSTHTIIDQNLKDTLGCGSRHMAHILTTRYANISERHIKSCFAKSKRHHVSYPTFTNRSRFVPVTARNVNERWQIDLVDMKTNSACDGEKSFRYILSIIDVFSRFLILRPLQNKSSKGVQREMEKIFAEHGQPEVMQMDQGPEFKGAFSRFLKRRGVKMVRSRPYNPQAQGKCEASHRGARRKIQCAMQRKQGFNWATDLHVIQEAINGIPKEVIGYQTPSMVYLNRTSSEVYKKAEEATAHCSRRMVDHHSRKDEVSVYSVGEAVLIRYPQTTKRRPHKRRFVIKGTVEKRDILTSRYQVQFQHPNGQRTSDVFEATDMTSVTKEKEKTRKERSKKAREKALKRRNHTSKYYISCDKYIEDLRNNHSLQILHDPRENPGSCQFQALSHQLCGFAVYRTPQQLRHLAVEHMRRHACLYRKYVNDQEFDEYLTKMEKESTYGDNMTLLSLAREFNMQVLVVSDSGPTHTALVSHNDIYQPELFLLQLGHYPEQHYVSIQVNRDCLNDLLRSFTNDTLPPDVQLASETPQESPVVSVTPQVSLVVSVTLHESPVVSVTPQESPVVSVTPRESPVVSVKSPVVSHNSRRWCL